MKIIGGRGTAILGKNERSSLCATRATYVASSARGRDNLREGARQCDEERQTMDSWTITRETTISGRESEARRCDEDERMGEEWANGDGG